MPVCTQGPQGPVITYEWGENATDEIGKRAVKEYVEQVYPARRLQCV